MIILKFENTYKFIFFNKMWLGKSLKNKKSEEKIKMDKIRIPIKFRQNKTDRCVAGLG